jgi:predicted enzyme involved in methoxymalonyl-ACP biosynthesis
LGDEVRMFGRQLEFEAMNIAIEAARRRGAKAFIADGIATPKNQVISALYPSLGFAAVNGSPTLVPQS